MKSAILAIVCAFGVSFATPAKKAVLVSSVNAAGVNVQVNQDLQSVTPKKQKEKKALFLVALRKLYNQPKTSF